jgi:DNA-binding MarR family transcriptional regulator
MEQLLRTTVRRTVVWHNSQLQEERVDDSPERIHQLVMDLIRVAGLLQPEQPLAEGHVSMSQAFGLHELDTDHPLSQRELAERLGLEKSTVSRMVAELERKGLVIRERDPANRRFYRLRLTPAGRTAHAGIAAAMHDHFVHSVSAMSATERKALLTGLPALIKAMRVAPPPADRD